MTVVSATSGLLPSTDSPAIAPLATYTAKSGDTLPSIARDLGIAPEALVAANPQILNPDVVYPDEQVILPAQSDDPRAEAPSQFSADAPEGSGGLADGVAKCFGSLRESIAHWIETCRATQAAEEIWTEPANNDATGRSGGAVTRNYKEVNASDPAGDVQAQRQVEANSALEAESLAQMTPEQRRQYGDLVKTTEGDPQARLALQLLAMQGKLTGQPLASDGSTLLTQLHAAATQSNAQGIDSKTLVCDMLREIATPSAIHQGSWGTCGPTSVQIKLAGDNPAEYARLVAGLASETGEVTLANGDVIRRDEGTENADASGRTQSSRLFQAALMEYGDGDANYDNATDTHWRNGQQGGGLGGAQVNTLMEGVFGGDFTTEEVSGMELDARRGRVDDIEAATARGESVPVAIGAGEKTDGSTGCHWVNVTRVEGDRVYYQNPWGQEESMSREEFAERLRAASLPS